MLTFLTSNMKQDLKEIKTVTITEKGQICIPNIARQTKGFEEGDKVSILVYNDRVELRPLSQIMKKLSTAFASEKVLAKDWNSKEDEEAWKNL